MYWADRFAKQIIESGKYKPYWVDDMKTPSGRIHVGSLRGVITHDVIYKALLDAGTKATFSYVIEDHDPMDGLPKELSRNKYEKYLGMPLLSVPSPVAGFSSFAQYYAQDFIEVFNECGCNPKIIWISKLYKDGQMNDAIRQCLEKADIIRKIYEKIYKKTMPDDWYPFQVVCPKCGKLSTTKVTAWDGGKVAFNCRISALKWTKGCGATGKISPFSTNGKYTGKLPWKVEWAVKWKIIGITVEGAGKDHMTKGGSHDIADQICKRILNYPTPFAFAHEFFLVGGKKMSSSKGLGNSARDMYNLLPAQILRFLILRPKYNQAIDFDPGGNTIANLFDEYDACRREHYKKGKKSDFARIWELSQIEPITETELFIPRFRDVANYIQLSSVDIYQKFEQIKGSKLKKAEKAILEQRIKYARLWLDRFAPKELVYQVSAEVPEEAQNLSSKQKQYLKVLAKILRQKQWRVPELEVQLYQIAKRINLSSKDAFRAIYTVLLGKSYGPKAAPFLLDQDQDFLLKRLAQVQTQITNKCLSERR